VKVGKGEQHVTNVRLGCPAGAAFQRSHQGQSFESGEVMQRLPPINLEQFIRRIILDCVRCAAKSVFRHEQIRSQ
jgi:hypothetical protein